MLINVKMPTFVGILTFISMINTTNERLKGRNYFYCPYLSFYEHEISCSVVEHEKSLMTSGLIFCDISVSLLLAHRSRRLIGELIVNL